MRKSKLRFFVLILFLIGCSFKEKANQNKGIDENKKEEIAELLIEDTINVKSESFHYRDTVLANDIHTSKEEKQQESESRLSIDSAAILILKGRNFWDFNDDNIVFPLMDNLLSEDEQTRLYYLPVFINIMKYSDGYVSEAVAGYSLRFVKSYPDEFIQLIDTSSDETVNQFAFFVGSEIYLSSDSDQELSNGKQLANSLTEKSDSSSKIMKFNEQMIKIIEQNLE